MRALIVDLIEQGRIVACGPVLGELRNDPIYEERLKPYEKALRAGDHGSDEIDYLQHVGRITHDYPAMSADSGEGEQ